MVVVLAIVVDKRKCRRHFANDCDVISVCCMLAYRSLYPEYITLFAATVSNDNQ